MTFLNLTLREKGKWFILNFYILFYSILFLGRYRITCGRIGDRIEIRRTNDALRKNHKFRIVQPLKIIRL